MAGRSALEAPLGLRVGVWLGLLLAIKMVALTPMAYIVRHRQDQSDYSREIPMSVTPAIGARGTARSRIFCDLTIRQGEYRPGPRAPAVRTARPERPDVTAARRWCCRRSSRW
jgi:hypothetical protein